MISEVYDGDHVLEWLGSDDAARQAERIVNRYGLSSARAVADDVLQDTRIAVWARMQRRPLRVDNPGGYGTQVLKREVLRILRGRYETGELPADDEPLEPPNLRPLVPFRDPTGTEAVNADRSAVVTYLDDLRVVVERTPVRWPWVTSAMLSVVTLRAHPDQIHVDGVPSPQAGATPDQALVWTALWFAGQRHHFPSDDDDGKDRNRKNQARSRMLREVLGRYRAACERYLVERGADHG